MLPSGNTKEWALKLRAAELLPYLLSFFFFFGYLFSSFLTDNCYQVSNVQEKNSIYVS